MWCLAADIGGTNSRLLAVNAELPTQQHSAVYASADYQDFYQVLDAFRSQFSITEVQSACLAVAGPIRQQTAKITNLPWELNIENLQQRLKTMKVSLLNDFESVGYGISALTDKDLVTLQQAEAEKEGVIAVLGVGTGLGQVIVAQHEGKIIVLPSEGGHVDFAPRDQEEMALLAFWQEKLPRVSYEAFLSGRGLCRIFEYYVQSQNHIVDKQMQHRMQVEDPAAVISEYAQIHKEPVAMQSLQRFVSIYASQAANLALTCKATGGVYLAGGIAPKIINLLQSDEFVRVFNDKAPMQLLLANVPVYVIMNTDVGLLGALLVAKNL